MIEDRPLHKGYADLHLHTNFSDGTMSPEELIVEAMHAGLDAIAITDHDILDGIGPALSTGEKYRIEVIPGIELSAEYNGEEVHILGFCMDWQDQQFREKIKEFRDSRRIRAMKMVDKLNELGMELEYDDVFKQADVTSIGRPHVAAALVEKGHVSNISEAFNEFLGDDGPAYLPKHKLSPAEAIALILDVGGIPVIAHPGALQQDIMPELISCGLMGLEALHPNHSMQLSDYYCDFAKQNHLLITGGSDCHGRGKGRTTMGSIKLPYEHVDALKKAKKTILRELERAAN